MIITIKAESLAHLAWGVSPRFSMSVKEIALKEAHHLPRAYTLGYKSVAHSGLMYLFTCQLVPSSLYLSCPIIQHCHRARLVTKHLAELLMCRMYKICVPVLFRMESYEEAVSQTLLFSLGTAVCPPLIIFD